MVDRRWTCPVQLGKPGSGLGRREPAHGCPMQVNISEPSPLTLIGAARNHIFIKFPSGHWLLGTVRGGGRDEELQNQWDVLHILAFRT